MSPPVLAQSLRLASSAKKRGGRCVRTEVEGCVTTVQDGEEVKKGKKKNIIQLTLSKPAAGTLGTSK